MSLQAIAESLIEISDHIENPELKAERPCCVNSN